MRLNLSLKALDSTDIEFARRCRNDWRIIRYCRQRDVISDLDQRDWYERQRLDPTIQMYKVVLAIGKFEEAVGVAGFTSISYPNRTAEFSLWIDPERQKMGFGRQALTILCNHGFENLGFNVIWGETFDGNPAGKMFEALGMVKEGTLRQRYWKDGRICDSHIYSLTRDEWKALSGPASSSSSPSQPEPSATSSASGSPMPDETQT